MYLEDVSLQCYREYERRRDFNLRTNCVKSLYVRCLPKVNTGKIGKVVLIAVEKTQNEPNPEELLDILRVYSSFDFEAFWKAVDDYFRKKQVLDLIQNSLLKIAHSRGWDVSAFHETYECVLKRNIVNEEYVKRPVFSPHKQLNAQLFYSFGMEEVEIDVIIKNTDGEVVKRFSVSKMPATGEGAFIDILGKLKWSSNDELVLLSQSGRRKWEFKLGK